MHLGTVTQHMQLTLVRVVSSKYQSHDGFICLFFPVVVNCCKINVIMNKDN